MQGSQGQSLVRELKSCMAHSTAKKKKKKSALPALCQAASLVAGSPPYHLGLQTKGQVTDFKRLLLKVWFLCSSFNSISYLKASAQNPFEVPFSFSFSLPHSSSRIEDRGGKKRKNFNSFFSSTASLNGIKLS